MSSAPNQVQTDLHNRLAGEIVASIVRPPIAAGGDYSDVMVLLESVVVGVCAVTARMRPGLSAEAVLELLVNGARTRLPDVRLASLEPEGAA